LILRGSADDVHANNIDPVTAAAVAYNIGYQVAQCGYASEIVAARMSSNYCLWLKSEKTE